MKVFAFLYPIGAAISWGLVYTLDQKILSKLSPLSFLFVYFLVGTILTLPILFLNYQEIKSLSSSGSNNLLLILISTALVVIASFFILSGVKILGAPTASILEIMYPLFVAIFGFLLFRQGISWYFALGGLLIFIGSAIVIGTVGW